MRWRLLGGLVVCPLLFVLQWALIISGGVLATFAMRALLRPMCPELGYTPLDVAFGARISGEGLIAGSTTIATDRVEWFASSRKLMGSRSTGSQSVPFH